MRLPVGELPRELSRMLDMVSCGLQVLGQSELSHLAVAGRRTNLPYYGRGGLALLHRVATRHIDAIVKADDPFDRACKGVNFTPRWAVWSRSFAVVDCLRILYNLVSLGGRKVWAETQFSSADTWFPTGHVSFHTAECSPPHG